MTIHIYFVKLDDVHVLQYCFSLPSRQKGHIMFRCIPLVVDAKELTYENPARSDRARHAFKHLAKTALGEKRERKLGIDEIVGLERKILERSLYDLQVPLGKAAQNGDLYRQMSHEIPVAANRACHGQRHHRDQGRGLCA